MCRTGISAHVVANIPLCASHPRPYCALFQVALVSISSDMTHLAAGDPLFVLAAFLCSAGVSERSPSFS